MARGLPALWSVLVSSPFIMLGVYLWTLDETKPSVYGIPFFLFGGFIVVIGLYIRLVAAPDPPTLQRGEEMIDTRNPAQRVAIAKVILGLPLLGLGTYLLFETLVPYVYPMAAFVVGLYVFSTGLLTYWRNTLTTYYITTDRLIKEYRFLSLVRQEVPFNKVRGVQQRKSLWETLVGLGNVTVSTGGGSTLTIRIRNVYNSTSFADTIRSNLQR